MTMLLFQITITLLVLTLTMGLSYAFIASVFGERGSRKVLEWIERISAYVVGGVIVTGAAWLISLVWML